MCLHRGAEFFPRRHSRHHWRRVLNGLSCSISVQGLLSGNHPVVAVNHTVILNWNRRAGGCPPTPHTPPAWYAYTPARPVYLRRSLALESAPRFCFRWT